MVKISQTNSQIYGLVPLNLANLVQFSCLIFIERMEKPRKGSERKKLREDREDQAIEEKCRKG